MFENRDPSASSRKWVWIPVLIISAVLTLVVLGLWYKYGGINVISVPTESEQKSDQPNANTSPANVNGNSNNANAQGVKPPNAKPTSQKKK